MKYGTDLIEIIPIDQVDPAWIEELLDQAFGGHRKGRTAYRVREGMEALGALSFAAVDGEGWLVGSIQCWPVMLTGDDGTIAPMIMVGPVAVSPAHQEQGIGRALVRAVLGGIGENETMPLMLIGDLDYYGRHFGFSAARTAGWRLPGPYEQDRLLAIVRDDVALPEKGMIGPYTG